MCCLLSVVCCAHALPTLHLAIPLLGDFSIIEHSSTLYGQKFWDQNILLMLANVLDLVDYLVKGGGAWS